MDAYASTPVIVKSTVHYHVLMFETGTNDKSILLYQVCIYKCFKNNTTILILRWIFINS